MTGRDRHRLKHNFGSPSSRRKIGGRPAGVVQRVSDSNLWGLHHPLSNHPPQAIGMPLRVPDDRGLQKSAVANILTTAHGLALTRTRASMRLFVIFLHMQV